MPTTIGQNPARQNLANDEPVLCLGVKQTAAAKRHGKPMGVGGLREDRAFQTWLIQLGVRDLIGGSELGYILSAGRADVRQQRAIPLKPV